MKWARQQARWLRSRRSGGVLILGYHRILTTAYDPYGMCVQQAHFEEHLAVLRRMAHPIRLEALLGNEGRQEIPARAVAITFDDGYVDNLEIARPLLTQYGVPATLFVVTGCLGRPFWWDELAELVFEAGTLPRELETESAGKRQRWAFSVRRNGGEDEQCERRSKLLQQLYQQLLPLDSNSREQIMEQLSEEATVRRADGKKPAARAMTADEVQQMAGEELLTIGAHSVTHPMLSKLPPVEQEREIVQSRDCLEKIIDRPVTAFSYPNGAGSDTTRTLLRQAGFALACASYNDVARPDSNRLFLPRFWVPDWDGDTFARWLDHWLTG